MTDLVPKRTSRVSRGRDGFTVVELLIAAAIVGVMAAAIMPSLISARADGRQSDAAQELVRLARRARARTLETGVAHLLTFRESASNGLGRVELHPGMSNRCRHTPWLQVLEGPLAISPSLLAGPDLVDMSPFNPKGIAGDAPKAADSGRHVITLRASELATGSGMPTDPVEVYICYEPSGRTYSAGYLSPRPDGEVPALELQEWSVLFTIARKIGTTKYGVDRQVVFPPGGNARVRL